MSVYVDKERNPFRRMIMCHMIADTREELRAMAKRLGLAVGYVQCSRSGVYHYDICLSKRAQAIRYGAIEINRLQTVEIIKRLRWSSKIDWRCHTLTSANWSSVFKNLPVPEIAARQADSNPATFGDLKPGFCGRGPDSCPKMSSRGFCNAAKCMYAEQGTARS